MVHVIWQGGLFLLHTRLASPSFKPTPHFFSIITHFIFPRHIKTLFLIHFTFIILIIYFYSICSYVDLKRMYYTADCSAIIIFLYKFSHTPLLKTAQTRATQWTLTTKSKLIPSFVNLKESPEDGRACPTSSVGVSVFLLLKWVLFCWANCLIFWCTCRQ